jgi:pilus assembly protein CpaB
MPASRTVITQGVSRVALLVALVTAVVGAGLLFVYLRRFEQEASGGAKIKLLVAIKPIEVGQVLTDDALATREVPQAYVEDRAVRDAERPRVVGLRVSIPVRPQETLMWTDLAIATDDRRDLSSLVQPGMRAVTVRTTSDGAFALIRPGDRVDVIATMQQANEQRTSAVILQNVLVLAVGLDTGAGGDPAVKRSYGDKSESITVSVRVPEAQLLSLALDKGRLSVALRNPDDPRIAEGLADLSSSSLADPQSRAAVQGNRGRPVALEKGTRP